MSTNSDSPLSKVQNLYLMQVQLWNFLDGKETDVHNAEKTLKEFKSLLKEVDWRLMGGEDVLESLQLIPMEVREKIKSTPSQRVTAKKVAKKPTTKKRKYLPFTDSHNLHSLFFWNEYF